MRKIAFVTLSILLIAAGLTLCEARPGPLIAPPFEPGHWDASWIAMARALRDAGVQVVKPERPMGFPDGTGASWLPPDLRDSVWDLGGPEQL